MEMIDKSVQIFLDELAGKQATPGGGSAAALMGAQAAALISMVCNLTLGKPKYANVAEEMQALLAESEALRTGLTDMIKADIDVFNKLMACYALPKNSDAEKSREKRANSSGIKRSDAGSSRLRSSLRQSYSVEPHSRRKRQSDGSQRCRRCRHGRLIAD